MKEQARKIKKIKNILPKNLIPSKKKQQIKSKIGKPPGTLIHVGEKELEKAVITLTEYNDTTYEVRTLNSIEDLQKLGSLPSNDKVRWIDFNGYGDVELLTAFGETFNIHPLILEDIVNSHQQPKVEYYNDDIFLVMKKITWEEKQDVEYDQISMLLTSNFLITFRDDNTEDYSGIRQRIENGVKVFRKSKADYLFYVLVDLLVDQYFLVVEELSERIEDEQENLLNSPDQEDLKYIQSIKKDAYKIKHAIRPVRESIASIIRLESDYISEQSLIYFRDALDHVIQVGEALESQRESITTLIDIYLSSISNRMNEVMKVLTIMASIFIPLTFIAGVYGMNFENIPELHYKYGYFIVWGVMIVVGISLLFYFKRKKWL
jgi:magnesium transporter